MPAGYVQTYRILDHPAYAKAVSIDDESWGLDLFLGEASFVGRGVGPAVLVRFAADVVFATTPAVAIVSDPPSSNRRSWRAFEKAGFRRWRTVEPPDEGSGDRLMRLERPTRA
jgi:RimJ/RimL family protein N-acetyltransferase